jgi:hypothetical protein
VPLKPFDQRIRRDPGEGKGSSEQLLGIESDLRETPLSHGSQCPSRRLLRSCIAGRRELGLKACQSLKEDPALSRVPLAGIGEDRLGCFAYSGLKPRGPHHIGGERSDAFAVLPVPADALDRDGSSTSEDKDHPEVE